MDIVVGQDFCIGINGGNYYQIIVGCINLLIGMYWGCNNFICRGRNFFFYYFKFVCGFGCWFGGLCLLVVGGRRQYWQFGYVSRYCLLFSFILDCNWNYVEFMIQFIQFNKVYEFIVCVFFQVEDDWGLLKKIGGSVYFGGEGIIEVLIIVMIEFQYGYCDVVVFQFEIGFCVNCGFSVQYRFLE